MNDKIFHDLFNATTEDGFITDASRRTMLKQLKSHNFLTFNPYQVNIYYISALFILIVLIGISVVGGGQPSNVATEQHETTQIEQEPAKKAVPVVKPEIKKEAVVSKKSEPKKEIKRTEVVYTTLPEVTGTPDFFTSANIPETPICLFLPVIPDSLPKQIKKIAFRKPIQETQPLVPTVVVNKKLNDTVIPPEKTITQTPKAIEQIEVESKTTPLPASESIEIPKETQESAVPQIDTTRQDSSRKKKRREK